MRITVSKTSGIALGTVLARSQDLVFSAVDDEISLMNVETSKYYGLASAGARIWALLIEPMSVQAICDRLIRQYRVDRATCEAHVLRFVEHLAAEGVVTTAPAMTAEQDQSKDEPVPGSPTGNERLEWAAPTLLVEDVGAVTQGGTTGDVNPVDDTWYS